MFCPPDGRIPGVLPVAIVSVFKLQKVPPVLVLPEFGHCPQTVIAAAKEQDAATESSKRLVMRCFLSILAPPWSFSYLGRNVILAETKFGFLRLEPDNRDI